MPIRSPPRFLYMQITKGCNLRCGHCDFWMRNDDDSANYLSSRRTAQIVEEFSELNAKGAVVTAGGEPMLNLDGFFDLARIAHRNGLRFLTVVNGTRIRSPAMAGRMINEGLDEISISLNSHRAALHDATRGVAGAFDKAIRALRLLIEARAARPGAKTVINVLGLIFDDNFREIEEFYDFVLNDIGADKLKLNFLQPSFGHDTDNDEFFEKHCRVDGDELVAVLKRADRRFKLGYNPIWLGQVGMYFRSLELAHDLRRGWGSQARTIEHICNTYDRNIMVDSYGLARLCFAGAFRGVRLARYGDLRRFWETSHDIRDEMLGCNRLCGISHSVRRETTTLASRGATQVVAKARPGLLGQLINQL